MEGGVHREDDTVDEKTGDDGGDDGDLELDEGRDGSGEKSEEEDPEEGGPRGLSGVGFFDERGGGGLDDAVADDPEGHEATDLIEGPTELCFEEHGEADDEPDIARGEEEESGGGEAVDGGGLGEELSELEFFLRRAEIRGDAEGGEEEDEEQGPSHAVEGALEAGEGEEESAEEEADALEGVF